MPKLDMSTLARGRIRKKASCRSGQIECDHRLTAHGDAPLVYAERPEEIIDRFHVGAGNIVSRPLLPDRLIPAERNGHVRLLEDIMVSAPVSHVANPESLFTEAPDNRYPRQRRVHSGQIQVGPDKARFLPCLAFLSARGYDKL